MNEARSKDLSLVLAFGPHSRTLMQNLSLGNLPMVELKAWKEQGALQDWQYQLQTLQQIDYSRGTSPTFTYDGRRGQIPRLDLPYGRRAGWGPPVIAPDAPLIWIQVCHRRTAKSSFQTGPINLRQCPCEALKEPRYRPLPEWIEHRRKERRNAKSPN